MSDWFLCMFSTASTLVVICLVMRWFVIACIPTGDIQPSSRPSPNCPSHRHRVLLCTAVLSENLSRTRETDVGVGYMAPGSGSPTHIFLSASPIYAQYSETLEGLEVVRAFQHEKVMIKENAKLVDANMATYLQTYSCNRWFVSCL